MIDKSHNKIIQTVTRKYINGKSIESIKNYLKENEFSAIESNDILKFLHSDFFKDRTKIANRDLLIAIILIALNLIPIILWIILENFRFRFGAISFLAIFAWRPFLASYITVKKDKKKITKPNKK